MATLTRLASTLTAKFSPSQTLTDAFYIDGRLCGKRETRQADITIEKEERGYFFSVFTHPTIEGFEPGMLPPFEPQFRSLCNDVKFGHKEIDSLIEKFLSTAVDVTGKMRLTDNEMRSPYFSGIIVKDAEAFAVTIGNGLAFLYRDDTLFPLTDAGIPMEAIDAFDNRVGDFMYYCASKTANALWSNYFTLSPDDCIILCNKAVYDALGQREILRILNEAEDQCDAAGVVITQASARMPNVPMQFSISFVENVTNTDKRGIFGFKKKSRDEGEENNVESVVEGGVVGAAAEAVSDAGFVALAASETAGAFAEAQKTADSLAFGEKTAGDIEVPKVSQEASDDKGFEVDTKVEEPSEKIEFLDDSVSVKPDEVTPEDMLKNSLNEMKEASREETEMETISVSEFNPETPTDDEPTKPVANLDASIFAGLKEGSVLGQAIKDIAGKEEVPEAEPAIVFEEEKPEEKAAEIADEAKTPDAEGKTDEIVFDTVDDGNKFFDVPSEESFNPYSAGDPDEMKNAAPLIFGDDGSAKVEEAKEQEPAEEVNAIPVPEFEIDNPKPELTDEDKLNVDFPETVKEEEAAEAEGEKESGEFKLPFANDVETVGTPEAIEAVPAMPEYDANVYDTPVNAVNSEEPIDATPDDAYAYGEYEEPVAAPADNAFFASSSVQEDTPYQPYGSEVFATEDQNQYRADDTQQAQTNAYSGYEQPDNGAYADQSGVSSSSSSGSSEDAWIMDLLGVDEGDYMREEIHDGSNSEFVADGVQGSGPANDRGESYSAGGAGPNGGEQTPVRKAAPSGRTGGGSGRSGGGKPKVHLNRNGYIFIAFVALLIICLIIMISLIVKACSNKETDESNATQQSGGDAVIINPTDESGDVTGQTGTSDSEPAGPDQTENTDGTTGEPGATDNTQGSQDGDPSAPIASFQFSDYIGYRTWWDLFNYVYNIQLSDLSDKRIKIIKEYNRFPSDYTPNSGDIVLLPPPGVLDGSIPNTFVPGEAQPANTPETTADQAETGNVDNEVTGEPALITATP